ncbi:MAG: ACP S-malonyltransferase [Betaproteobacteria bacterium]|nr:ACP S-malonyltransferase [Betaproteobacteria bacterium]
MKLAMVFPGQGSQAVGMLKAYHGLPGIDAVLAEATDALGAEFVRLLDAGPAEQLNMTVNTQPAMLTVGVAAYRAWLACGGPAPAIVAGHSLWEYAALVAAAAISFRDCLPLVRHRAQVMQEAVPVGEGAMAAILGLDDDAVRAACAESAGGQVVQAVNFNAPAQVVIAGAKAAVERAMGACKARGAKRALLLPVSAPFHSSLMQPAAEKLRAYLASVALMPAGIDVIHNVDVSISRDAAQIKDALVRQAASPVRWAETIRQMAGAGVTHVIECGPGKVLTGLTRRIDGRLTGLAIADRASLESALTEVKGA